MKRLECDVCDVTFEAEDFEGWFKQMMPHYMADHANIMKQNEGKSKEDGEKWMAEAKKRFEEAQSLA